jgi:beta-phosphoglucomutase
VHKIKAIIFDMDGVLIDAKEWHYESLNKSLMLFGLSISRYDHLVTYDGLPTKKKLEILTEERGFPEKLHNFVNIMKQIYTMELVHTKCKPCFHHEYALSKLKCDGYRLAVASNSIKETVRAMLEKAELIKYLDFFFSNEDVKMAKPDPEIYTKAISYLGFSPKEVLIIEDNEHGIEAARRSGAFVMEVRTVEEVNYYNIINTIRRIEKGS